MPTTIQTLRDQLSTPILRELPRPLLDYRIIIAVLKEDVGAAKILKDVLKISKELNLPTPVLALGPTRPVSLNPPPDARILWATFTDNYSIANDQRFKMIQPNNLTEIIVNLEKLSKTENGNIPLIAGDFLDSILSTPTTPAGLYSFLSELFTRIKTNEQTAFLLATDDMHDTKKKAILRKFADLTIEYTSVEDIAGHRIQANILGSLQKEYSYRGINETPRLSLNHHFIPRTMGFGRRYDLHVEHTTLVVRSYAIGRMKSNLPLTDDGKAVE